MTRPVPGFDVLRTDYAADHLHVSYICRGADLDQWATYGTRFLGMQLVDKSKSGLVVAPNGVVFTSEYEKVGQVFDLRIQIRTEVFDYTTRDGIPIKTRVTVRFQLDQVQFVKVQTIDRTVLRWPLGRTRGCS